MELFDRVIRLISLLIRPIALSNPASFLARSFMDCCSFLYYMYNSIINNCTPLSTGSFPSLISEILALVEPVALKSPQSGWWFMKFSRFKTMSLLDRQKKIKTKPSLSCQARKRTMPVLQPSQHVVMIAVASI